MFKSVSFRNGRIAYQISGKGKPLMLVHGFGVHSQIWDQQVAYIKDFCLVIIPELPGTGSSTLLTGSTISLTDYAEGLYAILVAENIPTCTMLGHSMGGYIGLAFAEKFGPSLNGLGLIHSSAYADAAEKKQIREKGIVFIQEHGSYLFLKTLIPQLFAPSFQQSGKERIATLIEKADQFDKAVLQQFYRAMIDRPDRTAVLKGNPFPFLFVMGDEDKAVPLSDVLAQVSLPQLAIVHELKGIGHMSMWEAPDLLNIFIKDFIQQT
jgi:pimeloyl-ACP methyl ester carboxylesterase